MEPFQVCKWLCSLNLVNGNHEMSNLWSFLSACHTIYQTVFSFLSKPFILSFDTFSLNIMFENYFELMNSKTCNRIFLCLNNKWLSLHIWCFAFEHYKCKRAHVHFNLVVLKLMWWNQPLVMNHANTTKSTH